MSHSNRIRLKEVRQAYRLLHECRDLGHDPLAWHQHMLTGLIRLVGASTAGAGQIKAPTGPRGRPALTHLGIVGSDDWARYCHEFMDGSGVGHAILYPRLAQQVQAALARQRSRRGSPDPADSRARTIVTCSREQLVSDAEWYCTLEFNEWRKPLGIDDQLTSQHLVSPTLVHGMSLHRGVDDQPFGTRERRLLHLFHHELGRHLDTALLREPDATFLALPPRLRQTLLCLLEGDGEKQAAVHLGLSRHTVHEYVTGLYRRFGVNSRPELLVLCLRRHPLGLG